ncbi:MAG: hypothetical protein PVI23_09235 [Maricaulaceae bacterium]|jgi:hypothetical protein
MRRFVIAVSAALVLSGCASNSEPTFFAVDASARVYEYSVWKPVWGDLNDALVIAQDAGRAYCEERGERFQEISSLRDANRCNLVCGVSTVQFTCLSGRAIK